MHEERNLDSLEIGQKATVKSIITKGAMRRRFLDIGLIPGSEVECLMKSPSGDPAAYLISGAVIAIRHCDALGVII